MIYSVTDQLDAFLPRFAVDGSQIQILESPQDFELQLMDMICKAKTRIYISTLYLSKDAFALRKCLSEALRENNKLKVTLVMDALRGTRSDHLVHKDGGDFFKDLAESAPQGSSPASMLMVMVREFGSDRIEVRAYHTPNYRGLWRYIIPERFNEGFGVQHTKIYGADDKVIISGANLSHQYFNNHFDRYYLITSEAVSDYLCDMVTTIGQFSYLIEPDRVKPQGFSLVWPISNHCASPLEHSTNFREKAQEVFGKLLRRPKTSEKLPTSFIDDSVDTLIYPVAQLAPLLGISASTQYQALMIVMNALCSKILAGATWTLGTAYFNPADFLRSMLLSTTSHQGRMVVAAPEATSFYGTAGMTGYIPTAFSIGIRRFLKDVILHGRTGQVTLMEWSRGRSDQPGGWTFHAKGLWVTLPADDQAGTGPCMTIVGSSNYGYRSLKLDLEQDMIIVTKNKDLKRRMAIEEKRVLQDAKPITLQELSTQERKTPWIVVVLLWIIQMIGASV